jgi:hypothetical protein
MTPGSAMRTMKRRHSRPATEKGAVLALVAVTLVTLLGFGTLAVDFGNYYHERRQMQTSADAAALAGAAELRRGATTAITDAALAAAGQNGFVHGRGTTAVTVTHPPATGPYMGDARYVEVVVRQVSPSILGRVVGLDSMAIGTRAVAGAAGEHKDCIYVLHPTAEGALGLNSSSGLITNCGVRVNSTHARAMWLQSSARIDAASIGISGSYATPSQSQVKQTPRTGVPRALDPLAHVAPPAFGACTRTTQLVLERNSSLTPGVYCGGIRLKNDAHLSLAPGVYVLRGGGLVLEGATRVSGTGVTLYNTTRVGSTTTYDPIVLQSSSSVDLRAPTTGPLAGIVIFGDRKATSGLPNVLEGGTNSRLEGAIYLPSQTLRLDSSATAAATYSPVVVNRLQMESSTVARINANYSSLSGGSPLKRLALVE